MPSNHPDNPQKLVIYTSSIPAIPEQEPPRHKGIRIKTRLSFQERLLRNSCLACAVLLGMLALGNLNHPLAQKASRTIQQALTMEIDLDHSLGQLQFVQKLMPESALVFFNLSGDSELLPPVQAETSHAYSPNQPWLMFASKAGDPVCACADGTVAAVSPLSDGTYGVLIDHGNGLESVTACLQTVQLRSGDKLIRGASIGTASGETYFELRQDGEAADPTEKLGL